MEIGTREGDGFIVEPLEDPVPGRTREPVPEPSYEPAPEKAPEPDKEPVPA